MRYHWFRARLVASLASVVLFSGCGGQTPIASNSNEEVRSVEPNNLEKLLASPEGTLNYIGTIDFDKVYPEDGQAKSLTELGNDFSPSEWAFFTSYVGNYELSPTMTPHYIRTHLFELEFGHFSWGSGFHLRRFGDMQQLERGVGGEKYRLDDGRESELVDISSGSYSPYGNWVLGSSYSNPNSAFRSILNEKKVENNYKRGEFVRTEPEINDSRAALRRVLVDLVRGDFSSLEGETVTGGLVLAYFKSLDEVSDTVQPPFSENKFLVAASTRLGSIKKNDFEVLENVFYSEDIAAMDKFTERPILFELNFGRDPGYLAVLFVLEDARYRLAALRYNVYDEE